MTIQSYGNMFILNTKFGVNINDMNTAFREVFVGIFQNICWKPLLSVKFECQDRSFSGTKSVTWQVLSRFSCGIFFQVGNGIENSGDFVVGDFFVHVNATYTGQFRVGWLGY